MEQSSTMSFETVVIFMAGVAVGQISMLVIMALSEMSGCDEDEHDKD